MRPLAAAVLCAALAAPGCVRGDTGSEVTVVTAVYPLTMVARRLAVDADVVDVTPPGAEPHDVELTPAQVGQVEQAELVVLLRGFQPALDAAAPEDRTLDALAGRSGASDPHVWLDPRALADVSDQVRVRLGSIDSGESEAYDARHRDLAGELRALHDEIAALLRDCARRDIVTSHAAFGWFARAYGLRETGIAGVDAEAEPSPRRIAEVAALVRERGVTTVFAESAESRPARTVAREAGVRVEVLDPLEVFRGDDYFTVMRRNARLVATALGCR